MPPGPGWYDLTQNEGEYYHNRGRVWVGHVDNTNPDAEDQGVSWGSDPCDDPEWLRAWDLLAANTIWTPAVGPRCDDCGQDVVYTHLAEVELLSNGGYVQHSEVAQSCPE